MAKQGNARRERRERKDERLAVAAAAAAAATTAQSVQANASTSQATTTPQIISTNPFELLSNEEDPDVPSTNEMDDESISNQQQ